MVTSTHISYSACSETMIRAALTQFILSIIGPILVLTVLFLCKNMQNKSLHDMLHSDISKLGKQTSSGIFITEPSQFMFMALFILISVMIMIASTARCFVMEKLFDRYSKQNRRRIIQCCNFCFIAGSSFIMAMSFVPYNKTIGHLISAMFGIFLILIGQIMDAFNYYLIYLIISKTPNIPGDINITWKNTLESVLLFVLPIIAFMCFLTWRIFNASIYEWFGVLFIMLTFMFYGYQSIFIYTLVQSKPQITKVQSHASSLSITNNVDMYNTWTTCQSASSSTITIHQNDE